MIQTQSSLYKFQFEHMQWPGFNMSTSLINNGMAQETQSQSTVPVKALANQVAQPRSVNLPHRARRIHCPHSTFFQLAATWVPMDF